MRGEAEGIAGAEAEGVRQRDRRRRLQVLVEQRHAAAGRVADRADDEVALRVADDEDLLEGTEE